MSLQRLQTRLSPEDIAHWSIDEATVERDVRQADRLGLVHRFDLLSADPDPALDNLVQLAQRLLGAPVTFFGVIGPERDFYKSICGAPEPLASEREISGRTFCHYTHVSGRTLQLDDIVAAGSPWVDVPTVTTLGVRAYLGVPVIIEGQTVGSLCAIDLQPRAWHEEDVATLEALAMSYERDLALRQALGAWRQLAQQRQENIVQYERLVAGIAHDMRTPLLAANLCAAQLAHRPDEGTARQLVPRLQHCVASLRHLIAQLQVPANAGASEPGPREPVSAAALLAQAMNMFQDIAAREDIGLSIRDTTDVLLELDLGQSLRALANVLGNALKFSPAGSRIEARAWRDDDGAQVHIEVVDQGPGMTPEELAACVRRGFQGERSLARGDGSGLGLAITEDILRAHGGGLRVRSAPGQGTAVRLSWPVAPGHAT